jgi:hypothetical protein
MKADGNEKRHVRQRNALRAIKVGDMQNRDVVAGRELAGSSATH